MDTNNVEHEHIALSDPGELIAIVPVTLGFHPADSLVVVSLDGADEPTVNLVMRADLPEPDQYERLAAQLAGSVIWQQASAVVLVVIGGPGPLPHRELLIACETRFAESGIRTTHKLWAESTAEGAQWHCYREADCSGVVTNSIPVHRLASELVYASREDIVATLAPDDDDALARRADLLAAANTDNVDPAALLRLVDTAVDRAAGDVLPKSDHDIVALAVALCDHAIRDACLAQPDATHRQAAERLWTALTRAIPAPERAEPACLLAFSAYQRGNGALASIALECADAADPAHRLTEQLRAALILGCPPSRIQHVADCAGRSARDSLPGGRP